MNNKWDEFLDKANECCKKVLLKVRELLRKLACLALGHHTGSFVVNSENSFETCSRCRRVKKTPTVKPVKPEVVKDVTPEPSETKKED